MPSLLKSFFNPACLHFTADFGPRCYWLVWQVWPPPLIMGLHTIILYQPGNLTSRTYYTVDSVKEAIDSEYLRAPCML